MEVTSVNVGQARAIDNGKPTGQSGIFKTPVAGAVSITADGLPGDAIIDTKNHGGPDQAIYVYGEADYAWWAGELGRDLPPGLFGENLTISGLASADFAIGDGLRVGTVVLEVTAPRIPCATLAARLGDPAFVRRFRAAERPGFYCRVIQPGEVQAGDAVTVTPYAGDTITVREMFRDFYEKTLSAAALRRYLAAPIAVRDRVDKEARLRELLGEA